LPDIGALLQPVFEPIANFLGKSIFGLNSPFEGKIHSDSQGMYVLCATFAIVAILTGLLWSFLVKRPVTDKHRYLFIAFIRYYLALSLFKYGFDKIFLNQFPNPEPNLLFTGFGNLTPDIMYWSTMGVSPEYSVFTGLMEVIPAILLLFRRTYFVGSIIAFFVLLNVVMINFGFDITVKLYSLFLLMLSLILVLPGYRKILELVSIRVAGTAEIAVDAKSIWRKSYPLLKTAIVAVFLAESIMPLMKQPVLGEKLTGGWEVIEQEGPDRPFRNIDFSPTLDRIFFHSRGYFIMQNKYGEFDDFEAKVSDAANTLVIRDGIREAFMNFSLSDNNNAIVIEGDFFGSWLMIKAMRILTGDMPANRREFHWTAEGVAGG
jgi:hypothetical protein